MTTNRIYAAAAALLILAGCAGSNDTATPAADADSAAAADGVSPEVRLAATIANAITAMPTKGDSILSAHNTTAEQLEQMMFRIAADSASSAAYQRLTGGR